MAGTSGSGGLLFRCQCLANRAACHLKQRNYGLCVDDAGAALAALGASSEDGGASGESRTLTLKLLARRGFAYCQLQRFEDAQGDYGKALEIDPHSEQLQKDYAAIGAQLKGGAK